MESERRHHALMMTLLLILGLVPLLKRTARHLPAYMGGRPATPDSVRWVLTPDSAQTGNYYLTILR